VKKYSFLGATKRLEDFLKAVKAHPDYFKNVNANDEKIGKLIDSGYLVLFPNRDKEGCRLVMLRPKAFDLESFDAPHSIILNILLFESILNEPETQICGIKYIVDFSDLPMNYLGYFSIAEYKHFMNILQNVMPARVKGIYLMNLPGFANTILQFLIGLLTDKLRKRVHFLKSTEELKTKFDPSLIPKEYGGKVSIQEMTDQQKIFFKSQRSSTLETFDCDIDEKLILANSSSSSNEIDAGTSGIFRKLEID
jgi:hypothetical protein